MSWAAAPAIFPLPGIPLTRQNVDRANQSYALPSDVPGAAYGLPMARDPHLPGRIQTSGKGRNTGIDMVLEGQEVEVHAHSNTAREIANTRAAAANAASASGDGYPPVDSADTFPESAAGLPGGNIREFKGGYKGDVVPGYSPTRPGGKGDQDAAGRPIPRTEAMFGIALHQVAELDRTETQMASMGHYKGPPVPEDFGPGVIPTGKGAYTGHYKGPPVPEGFGPGIIPTGKGANTGHYKGPPVPSNFGPGVGQTGPGKGAGEHFKGHYKGPPVPANFGRSQGGK